MNEAIMVQELTRLRNKIDTTRSLVTIAEDNKEIVDLAIKASNRLGYRLLLERYCLRNALAELEIEILDESVVREYMKLARRMKNGWRFWAPWSWNIRLIQSFRKPIPEFVLNKAVQIVEKCPGVEICVAVLSLSRDEEFFYPDPFLIATTNRDSRDEFYYVEVWDENEFEGRLRKKEKERR